MRDLASTPHNHTDATASSRRRDDAPRFAIFLPIVVALVGLAAIGLAPRTGDRATADGVDFTITGSIQAAPIFHGRTDEDF